MGAKGSATGRRRRRLLEPVQPRVKRAHRGIAASGRSNGVGALVPLPHASTPNATNTSEASAPCAKARSLARRDEVLELIERLDEAVRGAAGRREGVLRRVELAHRHE